MKNYRKLVPLVLVVLLLLSWYTLASDASETGSEYNQYLEAAREYAKTGVTKLVIQNYTAALELNPSVEIYAEAAEYYKAQGENDDWVYWCEDFFELYPTEPKAYDCLLEAYLAEKDYESCYDVLEVAGKRNVTSDYITSVSDEIAYYYETDFNNYDEVGVFSNSYCAVKNKEVWGYVDCYGEQQIGVNYASVGDFSNSSSYAPVVDSSGNAFYIDKDGDKILASNEGYQWFGMLLNGIAPAQKADGSYVYVDEGLGYLFGDYDYASTVNYNIAAVKKGDNWSIIDGTGAAVTASVYKDVKLDEKGIAYRNDRLFVSMNGSSYIMIDAAGNQVGTQTFEDACVFGDTTYAAVKINGKWCFIDKDGNLKSDKTYEGARSYVNGLAAVKVGGQWGFVDEGEELRIPAEFMDARDFNEKGSCFVKTGDKWQLIKLYRLNRKG